MDARRIELRAEDSNASGATHGAIGGAMSDGEL